MLSPQPKRVIALPASRPVQTVELKRNSPTEETLVGVVERLTYYSGKSGYTIARLQVPCERDLVMRNAAQYPESVAH